MTRIALIVLVMVMLVLTVAAQDVEQDQVVITLNRDPVTLIEQGSDGLYYVYCLYDCHGLVSAVDVTERYRGFSTFEGARLHYDAMRALIP